MGQTIAAPTVVQAPAIQTIAPTYAAPAIVGTTAPTYAATTVAPTITAAGFAGATTMAAPTIIGQPAVIERGESWALKYGAEVSYDSAPAYLETVAAPTTGATILEAIAVGETVPATVL